MKKLTNEGINDFIRENKESEKNFEKITIGDCVTHPTFTNLKWTVESIFTYKDRLRARLVSDIDAGKLAHSSSFLDDLTPWSSTKYRNLMKQQDFSLALISSIL